MARGAEISVAEFAEWHRQMVESSCNYMLYIDEAGGVCKVRADEGEAAQKIYRDPAGLIGVYDHNIGPAELLADMRDAGVSLMTPRRRRGRGRPKKELAHA